MRGLALRIVLASTITSVDHFIELLVTLEERIAVLLGVLFELEFFEFFE
jgi:hypothetical protein